jgi:lipopolysaccharide/colanic/teichoic acid biosynthesis glycosyltransferase
MATMDSGYEGDTSVFQNVLPKPMSDEAFRRELRRERSRSDRNGKYFSLIRFSQKSQAIQAMDHLISLLQHRLRKSDRLGWYDENSIAVLLPATPEDGARRYVLDLQSLYPDLQLHFDADLETYPMAKGPQVSPQQRFSYAGRTIEEALAPPIPLWKRMVDVTGASAGIVLFSPLFLLFPLYIRLVSPGPVYYKQERVGFRGKSFTFLKFRTMHVNNSVSSHKSYLKDVIRADRPMEKLDDRRDPRIIFGARLLRNTALDEVPQFINVLKGEMTLVGPRPCIPYEAEEYLRWHAGRFDVLPGMSGLWQVSGKNRLSFGEMIRLDIAYSRNMSLWLDLKIIALTFPSIVREIYLKFRDKLSSKLRRERAQHEQEESR